MRLGSVRTAKKWGSKNSLPFERGPTSNREPISIVFVPKLPLYCVSVHLEPHFEIRFQDEAYNPIYTTLAGTRFNVNHISKELIVLDAQTYAGSNKMFRGNLNEIDQIS